MIATKTEQREAKDKALASGLLVAALLAACLLLAAGPAHAATTFTVNSTGDGGDANLSDLPNVCDTDPATSDDQCTLRAAIQEANNTSEADTINFAIPGNGPHTIAPASELPAITDQVTIDGYTEQLDETPGASANTSAESSTNAELRIVLSGVSAGTFKSGLRIYAPNAVVMGLVINNWHNHGIQIASGGSGTSIEGNFLGTDADGTSDQGNRIDGVEVVNASGVSIGGTTPDKRNLLSGNGNTTATGSGVEIVGSEAMNNKVEGNLIGTDAAGTADLGNAGAGVVIATIDGNTVGGVDDPGTPLTELPANTIAFNDRDGVWIVSGIGNRIVSNSIFSNSQLGIDLLGGANEDPVTGVTPNDKKDPDTGPNLLQNFPRLTSATTASGTTTINGTLNSRPRKTFTIQFFSSQTADLPGFGEGETFLGQKEIRTNREGKRSFTFPAVLRPGEKVVTATATNDATGDTSEFSNAVTAT